MQIITCSHTHICLLLAVVVKCNTGLEYTLFKPFVTQIAIKVIGCASFTTKMLGRPLPSKSAHSTPKP